MYRRLTDQEVLETVLQVSKTMGEMRALEPLLKYATDELLSFTGAERGYIILLNNDGELEFKIQRDAKLNGTASVDETSHTIINDVITKGEPVILSNAMTDPRFSSARSVLVLKLRSILCVPLRASNRVIGAIYLENRSLENRFLPGDLSSIELWANQAAVAIENARLNDTLEVANKHLQELDELKNNFVLLVSHELRTPLSAVMIYSSLLGKTKEEAKITQLQERMDTAVEKLNKTIGEIIQVFRLISGQQEVHLTTTPASTVIESVLYKLEPLAEQRQIKLHLRGLDALPPLYIDGSLIKTVLDNILGNALKYTPDGSNIYFSANLLTEGIEFIIRDEGIGVPESELERVFDIFHTLGELKNHSTSKHEFRGGGLGLGLPISKSIVEAHGGTIRLESPRFDPETCPGATCTVFLPYGSA